MACKRCGKCCTYVEFPIKAISMEWARLHGLTVGIAHNQTVAQAPLPCQAYDPLTRRCSIYEKRPIDCKVFICEEEA